MTKTLRINVTQRDQDAPTGRIFENTFGATPVLIFDADGEYSLEMPSGTFPPDRVFILTQGKQVADNGIDIGVVQNDDRIIKITTVVSSTGEYKNSLLNNYSISIQVDDSFTEV